MCRRWSDPEPCTDYRCTNNLFWEGLELDREKIRMTDKALEIRNCCCLIMNPWTPEEISNTWGLTREQMNRSEEEALKKLQREVYIGGRSQFTTAVSRKDKDLVFIRTVLEKREKESKNLSAILRLDEKEQMNTLFNEGGYG